MGPIIIKIRRQGFVKSAYSAGLEGEGAFLLIILFFCGTEWV
jgi:hypothetical protein